MTANDKRIAGLHEGPQGVRTSDYQKIVPLKISIHTVCFMRFQSLLLLGLHPIIFSILAGDNSRDAC